MADVTIPDVFQGTKLTWATNATLLSFVPQERLYAYGVPENTAFPYAAIQAEDISNFFGGTELFSGRDYIKGTKVTLEVYAQANIQWGFLAAALNDTFNMSASNVAASWIIPNAVQILSAVRELEVGPVAPETPARLDSQDILMYSIDVEVRYQAQRNA